jgi:hypothetical protein
LSVADVSWVSDLVRDSRAKAWGVYLASIYLFVEWGFQDFADVYSARDAVLSKFVKYFYASRAFGRYFVGRGEELYHAFEAGKRFIEEMLARGIGLKASDRRAFLEEVIRQYLEAFTRSCREYVRPNAIPADLAPKVIELSRAIQELKPLESPSSISGVTILNKELLHTICVQKLGLSVNDVNRFLHALISSGLAIELGSNYIVLTPCLASDIMDLVASSAGNKSSSQIIRIPSGAPAKALRNVVKKLVSRELPYRVGLIPYLYFEYMYWVERGRCASGSGHCIKEYIIKDKEVNVRQTLQQAFNESIAEKVYKELEESIHKRLVGMLGFKKLRSIRSAVKQALIFLRKKSRELVVEESIKRISKGVAEEIGALRIASLFIVLNAMGIQMPPNAYMRIVEERRGFTVIELAYDDQLSKIVSYISGKPVQGVEALFYRYLLGFRGYVHTVSEVATIPKTRIILYPSIDMVIARLALEALHNRNVIKALTSMLPPDVVPDVVKGKAAEFLGHVCTQTYYYMTFLNLTMRKVPRRAESLVKKIEQLKREGKAVITYQDLKTSDPDVADKILNRLVLRGYVKAVYTGPSQNELPEKCRDIGFPKDPWTENRARSGELKIWLIRTTGNRELKKKRRECWGPYIILDFTKFFNEMDRFCGSELVRSIST